MIADFSYAVVIPCYKQARYLPESIGSVLAQTVKAAEIVVVDDGSPDHPEEVCQLYGDAVQCHRQENRGVSAARNAGLALTSSPFVVFLDADDRLLPEAAERQLQCFRECPDLGLVFGKYRQIDADGKVFNEERPAIVQDDHYANLLRRDFIQAPVAVMFRRDVMREVGGFDSSVDGVEDYDMYLRIARIDPIRGLDRFLGEYRHHSGGATRDLGRMMRQKLRVLDKQWPIVAGDPRLRQALLEGIARTRRMYGQEVYWKCMETLRSGQYRLALNQFVHLGVMAPGVLASTLGRHIAWRAKTSLVRGKHPA